MDEEKKGDDGNVQKNGGGGLAKRGNNKRVGIDGYVLKEKEGNDYDDANLWDEHNFDVGGKDGAEWGNDERGEGDGNNNDEESEEEE